MKRKILSVALCLSMLVSLVAFAPFSFAVDTSEPFTMSEQNNNDASADNTVDDQTNTQTDSSAADPGNQPADTQDAEKAPADSQQSQGNQAAEPVKPAPEANEVQEEMPKTVPFTEAGPFFPAVNVGKAAKAVAKAATSAQMSAGMLLMSAPKAALAEVTPEPTTPDGLNLSKAVKPNAKDGYTLTLDAYTTGTVSTSEKMIPVDIVLVLDQSGSMRFDMNGNDRVQYANSRQKAMKDAVDNFIKGVASKYTKEADHRISIVTFGSSSKLLSDWTDVNEEGANKLRSSVSRLPQSPEGATNVAAGMGEAVTQMVDKYNYIGNNTNRQKVVITFTDGVPTTGSDFNTTVATNAIKHAKTLKDQGCTSYSIGIFTGANPSQISGIGAGTAGNVGDSWKAVDVDKADIPAGNRFLNFLSSNFETATEVGLERRALNHWVYTEVKYTIKTNFDRTNDKYYLTASNSEELNNIFQNIVENIVTPSIQLGSETVIKDIIADSFELPKDASNIRLYTADAKADGSFAQKVNVPAEVKYTVAADGKTINVTGFDFNKNFVSKNAKPNGSYGKKLIIEIDVKVKDGFLGGNNVPTNGVASGVYVDKDSVDAIGRFPVPTVDISLAKIAVNPQDKNVYLLGDLTDKDFAADKKVTFKGAGLEGKSWDELADWQKKYVDLNVTVENGVATDLTKDTEYTVNAVLSAKANPQVKEEASGKAKINVFRPEVTYKDVHKFYGEAAPDAAKLIADVTAGGIKWTHGETAAEDVTMIGEIPSIDRTAVLTTPDHVKNEVYATADDSYYKVTTKIGNTDIAGFVINKHQNCDPKCDFDMNKGQFAVHKDTCTLKVTKNVTDGGAGSFVMKVDGSSKAGFDAFEMLVEAGQTVTLKGLPIGTYTVTEDTDWAWKYTAGGDNGKPVELTAGNANGSITITNTPKDDKWLNFVTSVQNLFTGEKPNA